MAQTDYKLKIVAILRFISISLSALIAYDNPAKDYELSIYESTSYLVWFSLIISIAGGVTIIVHQVYTKEYRDSNFWMIGLLILILSRITLLYIPYIRGYYTWNGDNLTHIGFVKDILLTGHISSDNSYPVTHILLTEFISISGAPVELIINHSTALFSIFYVVSIYLLATAASPSRDVQLLSVAAIGGVLFNTYNVYLMPNGWSIFYLPLVFFLFFRSLLKVPAIEYKSLLAITLILVPFFHPLSSTMLIIMLLTVGTIKYLIYVASYKKLPLRNILHFLPVNSMLVVLIILLPWLLSFQKFNANIIGLYNALTTGHGPDAIAEMGEQLNKVNIHGLDFLNLTFKIMGDDIIYLVLSVIAVIILFKKREEIKSNNILIILLGITFVSGMMYIAYLFGIIPGLENFGAPRLLAYLVIFTPISAAFTLKHLICKKTHVYAIICIVIIQTTSMTSIFSLYPSPYIIQPNIQITRMDLYGAKWFIDYKDMDIRTAEIMTSVDRIADAISGTNKRADIMHASRIPDHFNYTVSNRLGESYTTNKYAVFSQFDRQIYDTVWKKVGRFHKEDFEKLEIDPSVDKLYSNGGFTIWYIRNIP